jgi:aminobenzoyl-glutamate utilization protein B
MVHVAKVMAATAVEALSNRSLIDRAKADYRVRTDGNPYVCPLPEDVKPPIKSLAV